MIGYLKGQILDVQPGKCLIGIQSEHSVIGYELFIPQDVKHHALQLGDVASLYIYSHIRQDQFDLFGFLEREQKTLFLTVLDVSGVGPKSALSIVSSCSVVDFVQAILSENQEFLSKVPGIGKKTSSRVLLELKDKVAKKFNLPLAAGVKHDSSQPFYKTVFSDARAALGVLGYDDARITAVLKNLFTELPHSISLQELIRHALKRIDQNRSGE
jgi:Holliday junction DNA helicase RuvA